MTISNKIKVAIVDDDSLVVQLLAQYLEQAKKSQFEVLFTANSGNVFIEKLTSDLYEEVDIILLDMRMRDGDGISVLEQLKQLTTNAKIVVLSSYYKDAYVGQMINLGVHAFLPKEIDKEELISIIEETYHKGHYFSKTQLTSLRNQIAPKAPKLHIQPKDTLTARELEILQLVAQQYTTREIADKLFISHKTVEVHKSNLLSKTGTKNTAGLIIYAIHHQLINPDDFMILG